MNPGMYSSNKQDWETPWLLFLQLNREFRFTLDACATASNTKCSRYITPEQDAFYTPWGRFEVIFVNPPYGRTIGQWICRAYHQAIDEGNVVVMLLPARTDTKWWHNYVMKADEIRFIRGRVRFEPSGQPAPMPSCVVVFRGISPRLVGGPPRVSSMLLEG